MTYICIFWGPLFAITAIQYNLYVYSIKWYVDELPVQILTEFKGNYNNHPIHEI
jgi:hypothetical protein